MGAEPAAKADASVCGRSVSVWLPVAWCGGVATFLRVLFPAVPGDLTFVLVCGKRTCLERLLVSVSSASEMPDALVDWGQSPAASGA